ncbi:MAG: PIN domain-containing protein [Thermococcus sp.]|nr:PIN domain-containing protein [Thermococcus sp.]
MIVLPDTSALVELIRGSEIGNAVLEILEGSDIVMIPTLVLAELASFMKRNNMESAKKYDAIVLTTDHHFKILGNAIILEK